MYLKWKNNKLWLNKLCCQRKKLYLFTFSVCFLFSQFLLIFQSILQNKSDFRRHIFTMHCKVRNNKFEFYELWYTIRIYIRIYVCIVKVIYYYGHKQYMQPIPYCHILYITNLDVLECLNFWVCGLPLVSARYNWYSANITDTLLYVFRLKFYGKWFTN